MYKKTIAILSVLIIFTDLTFGQTDNKREEVIPVKDLKSDLKYLKNKLENLHPNLYLYSPKTRIDFVFDSLENSMTAPLTELEFYRHVTIISSVIKDGHTIILPGEKITDYHKRNSKFLPYHFAVINGRLFVDQVCTKDSSIKEGTEIISINKQSSAEILNMLMERQVRDGNNLTYPSWILNNYFREYYSFIFGHPEKYEITYNTNGQAATSTINALLKDSIYFYRQQRYPGRSFVKEANDGIRLSIEKERNYAVLTIRSFENSILKKEYKQNFERTVSDFFEQISNSKTENLVLDLRNNQGGDIENGVFLLSYLLDKPFTVVQDYVCIENSELVHCNGPSLGVHKPKQDNFKGKLFVLINGGSFSNSGIVASCLQANNRAVFIGDETGGSDHALAGFIKTLSLPNSNIRIELPTRQFLITDKTPNTGHGIFPTHVIKPLLADILEGKDTEMNYTIGLINKQQ